MESKKLEELTREELESRVLEHFDALMTSKKENDNLKAQLKKLQEEYEKAEEWHRKIIDTLATTLERNSRST